MDAMKYNDLRDFLTLLEQQGELKRITLPVDPHLEITEIAGPHFACRWACAVVRKP